MMCQVHALHRSEFPALHLLSFGVVKRWVYLWFTRPTYFRVAMCMIHQSLGEERRIDTRVYPSTDTVRNAE